MNFEADSRTIQCDFFACVPNSNRHIRSKNADLGRSKRFYLLSIFQHIDNACLFFHSEYTGNTSSVMDGSIPYTLLTLDALCVRLSCHFFSLWFIRRFIDWYFRMCSWRLTHIWHESVLEWRKSCSHSQQPTASVYQDRPRHGYFWNSHKSYLLNWYVHSRILLNFANNDEKKWFLLRRCGWRKNEKFNHYTDCKDSPLIL